MGYINNTCNNWTDALLLKHLKCNAGGGVEGGGGKGVEVMYEITAASIFVLWRS